VTGAARNSFRRKQPLVTAAKGALSMPIRTEFDGNGYLKLRQRLDSGERIVHFR